MNSRVVLRANRYLFDKFKDAVGSGKILPPQPWIVEIDEATQMALPSLRCVRLIDANGRAFITLSCFADPDPGLPERLARILSSAVALIYDLREVDNAGSETAAGRAFETMGIGS